ncbi:MAG TPA: mechanosensitive ion channel domain-containing protein [Planctomycetota bacterium]|nr:mechanosensitive ion channel domain-containing protein [Planctomycetota bacterium]
MPEHPAGLAQDPDVQQALEQTGAPAAPPPPVERVQLAWLASHALLLMGSVALYYLLRLDVLHVDERYMPFAQRGTLGAIGVVLVLGAARAVDVFLIRRLHHATTRFNLHRLIRLVAGIAIFFIALSVLSATWYTAVVSLGLISLVLGFALQTPITSFIGWLYILVRTPYRVGDRIRMGDATGDVIDVGYLDTTLWEIGGDYLTTDHPSGRLIKFPNSNVLTTAVINSSWPLFPYIWNEIRFHVAYNSDLEFVASTMQDVAESALGADMRKQVAVYRQLLAQTPVNQLDVRERPSVFFRVSDNTWLIAIVRYLVEPRQAGRVKSRLIVEMLERLNAEPGRVRFPKDDLR